MVHRALSRAPAPQPRPAARPCRRRAPRALDLPAWARRPAASLLTGGDLDALDARLLDAAGDEAEALGAGMALLWRDVKVDAPIVAKAALRPKAELTERERARAGRAREYGWPAFWFANIFMNTVPWTPLVLPLVLRVVAREKVIPPQMDVEKDRRLKMLMARRRAAQGGGDD